MPNEEKIVSSSREAQETAWEFGFPVVLKGLLPGEIHKTEFGLVRTGIYSVEEVESALLELQKIMSGSGTLLIQKLLDGFRGFAAVDRDRLTDILVRIGELGLAYPQIKEIDLNPLIVSGGKPIAVDATIVLDG